MKTAMKMSREEREEAIRTELLSIKALNPSGRLTPDDVVKFAADTDTALHACFEWDDSRAAHSFRVEQARHVIAKVRIDVVSENRRIQSVYYVRDPNAESGEQGYVSVDDLRTDADLAREALVNEFIHIRAMLSRAKNLAAAIGMEDEVVDLINSVSYISRRLNTRHNATAAVS